MAIKVYIADYKKLGIDKNWQELLPYLTGDEREKVLRYRFDEDKIRSLTGVCLIRSAAAERFPGETVSIMKTDKGKPYLSGRTGYEFNLSHSGDLIVLAVDELPVGIDVEQIKDKNWEIFHRYLTDEEMSMIRGSDDPPAVFFEVWTVREAFSKEEGQGLSILDSIFSMDYHEKTVSYNGKKLYFRTEKYSSSEKYRISLCSRRRLDDVTMEYLDIWDWERRIGLIRQGNGSSQNLHKNY